MTIEVFNKIGFHAGMRVRHNNLEEYLIIAVDFEEALIGVEGDGENLRWLRCENCEII